MRETDIGMYRHFCLETDDLEELRKICLEKEFSFGRNLPTWRN